MASCTGTDIASLKALTRELAREAVFGKDVLSRNSLSGQRGTGTLDQGKMDYIKSPMYHEANRQLSLN